MIKKHIKDIVDESIAENKQDAKNVQNQKDYIQGTDQFQTKYAQDQHRMKVVDEWAKSLVNKTMTYGTDSAGGYLVPEEVSTTILEKQREAGFINTLFQQYTMGSMVLKVVVENGLPTASRVAENVAVTPSDASFNEVTLTATKIVAATEATREELLQNEATGNLGSWLTTKMSQQIGRKVDTDIINGNGTSEPTGISSVFGTKGGSFNYTDASSTTVNTVTYDEIQSWYYSLNSEYRREGFIIIRDEMIPVLTKLADGSTGDKIFTSSLSRGASLPSGAVGSIGITPVYVSNYINEDYSVGSSGGVAQNKASVMIFAHPSAYLVGNHGGVRVESSDDVGFLEDTRYYKAVLMNAGNIGLGEGMSILAYRATA